MAIALIAATARLLWSGHNASVAGPALVLEHVVGIALSIALIAICIGLGRIVLLRFRLAPRAAACELTLAATLGLGVVATVLLVISASIGPHWYTLWSGLAVLVLLARRDLAGVPPLLLSAWHELTESWPQGGARRAGVITVIVLAVVMLLLTLTPPVDYDSLAYHLRVPQQWVAQGRLFLPEDNYHTAFVGVNELLFLPLLSFGASAAPQVLNGALTLLLGVGVFAMAKVVAGVRTAGLAFLLIFGSSIVLLTGITPMVDVTLALVLVGATLALLLAWKEASGNRLMFLAGVLLGIAMGVKYLGILYAGALAPVFLIVAIQLGRRSFQRTAVILFGTAALAILAAGPWAVKNIAMFGNPVFPFGSIPRAEPWLRSLYPDLVPNGVSPDAFTALTDIRKPINLRSLILAPAEITSDVNGADLAPFWVLFLAPFALLAPARRKLAAVLLPALGFIGLLLAYSRYTNLRYFIPAIPGVTVAAAVVLVALARRLSAVGRAALCITVAILALPAGLALWRMLDRSTPLPYILGASSQASYLNAYPPTSAYMKAVAMTDSLVPAGSRVVLLFEARGFYFASKVEEDILIRNWAMLTPYSAAPGCLLRADIGYFLVNDWSRDYFIGRGASAEALGWNSFPPFRERCLTQVGQVSGYTLYRVRDEAGGGSTH
jgi:hypothetical protein